MVLSRLNQRDLVQDDTYRVCEDGYCEKEEIAYITQASISLYPPRSIRIILPPPPSSAKWVRVSPR